MQKFATTQPIFSSFFQGGFECATHRRRALGQMDLLAATRHDVCAAGDYSLVAKAGVRTVRDGLRWHLIERSPGIYDWSSFLPMLEAARSTGTEVLWDLCHWGVPEGLDPFSPEFITRFARFAGAAAQVVHDATDARPVYCPINEISFWSWVGADRGAFFPYAEKRGADLKRQLAAASIAAIHAVRCVDPRARFLHCEPIIQVGDAPGKPETRALTISYTEAQHEAWDMIAGRLAPELGGDESCLDLLGCNYYWNNQWQDHGELMPLGHSQHVPLHRQLIHLQERYGRPLLLSETGAEAGAAIGWLGMVCAEAREAIRHGVNLQGICLYPVMDYPGWDDGRHCETGLIATDDAWQTRRLRPDLVAELQVQYGHFHPSAATIPA